MDKPRLWISAAADQYLPEIAALFVCCFSEPPWNEVFDALAVERDMLRDYLNWMEAVFIVGKDGPDGKVLGAAIGFGIERYNELPSDISARERGAFYIAEIFVHPGHRREGIASAMTKALLLAAQQERGFTRGVVRTSISQPIIQKMFQDVGFVIVGRQLVSSTKLVDGVTRVVPDERVILAGNL